MWFDSHTFHCSLVIIHLIYSCSMDVSMYILIASLVTAYSASLVRRLKTIFFSFIHLSCLFGSVVWIILWASLDPKRIKKILSNKHIFFFCLINDGRDIIVFVVGISSDHVLWFAHDRQKNRVCCIKCFGCVVVFFSLRNA